MSTNSDLAKMFEVLAAILDIKSENRFKAIAFAKVSRVLGDMTDDIRLHVADHSLNELEGIGASSRKIIEDFVHTGKSADYEELVASVPEGLIPMLSIPSLGPKTIALLWKERNITSTAELVEAIASKKLDGIKGIGPKKIESIRQGIEMLTKAGGRIGIVDAMPVAQAMLDRLKSIRGVRSASIAGSLRRGRETIGDVDLICASSAAEGSAIALAFTQFPEVQRVLAHGNTKASILTTGNLQVDLRIVPEESFGSALLYFTGSKDHNVILRSRAQDMGMTLNEWGLYRLAAYEKADKQPGEAPSLASVAGRTEQDVYQALKLDYIEPELREDRGEIPAAEKHELPTLIIRKDIRGDLHTHTDASDGVSTIEEMARAAKDLGYAYLGITDHSRSQAIANGLSVERLLAHIKEIHRVGRNLRGIRLLAGCEVDILADGQMDYDDDILAQLDFVVASPHTSLKQSAEKATDRILRAIENRYVNIIGHPTGRLIDRREGLPIDINRIAKAAAANGTALEINASYPRLDLNDVQTKAALAAGAMLSINTDSHAAATLPANHFGITQARRGWATPDRVINTFTLDELFTFFDKKSGRGLRKR